MENTEDNVQISMSFQFLKESITAKTVFLLQPDSHTSYQLISDFQKFNSILKQNIDFKVHYKIFKNTPLDDFGRIDSQNPDPTKDVTYIGDDYFFVVQNDSFKKDKGLFLETIKQICLFYFAEDQYFRYMNAIKLNCFIGPDTEGNFRPIKDFIGCTEEQYNTLVDKKTKSVDDVNYIFV